MPTPTDEEDSLTAFSTYFNLNRVGDMVNYLLGELEPTPFESLDMHSF